jgi:hypothetical protein
MDTRFVSEHQIPTRSLALPIPVFLADGGSLPAGFITKETVPLSIDIAGHLETLVFKVVRLTHPLMVGLPWLQRHNPTINWHPSSISFSSQWCLSHCANSPIKVDLSYASCSSVSSLASHSPSLSPTTSCNNSERPPVSSCCIDTLTYRTFFRKARAAEVFVCWINADGLSSSGIQSASISSVLTTKTYATSSIPLSDNGIPLKYQALGKAFQTSPPGSPSDLPPHREYDLSIDPHESKPLPPPGKIYPLSPAETTALQDYITNALALGRIRPSKSPLGAPCFFVKKPNGGLRLCINYRGLNNVTRKDSYPLPLIADLFDRLGKARIYTRLDLPDAYHLVRIKEGDEWKTTFHCKFGSFEYNVIPFGLTNAPAAFQSFMNDIFANVRDDFVVVYLDDILIYSEDPAKHDDHVCLLLDRLIQHGLAVRPEKCSFDLTEIDFLGHIISVDGIRMDPAKVAAVKDWTYPKDKKSL